MLRIALIEPFFSGSHQTWALAYQRFSRHDVRIFSLPGRHWKWRMHGGAVSLSGAYANDPFKADLFLVSDMLDVATFRSLLPAAERSAPIALYFHENQLTYPWSPGDPDTRLQRDRHYAFINFTSALTVDRIFFNSDYHRHSFIDSLPDFLKAFPDQKLSDKVAVIREKSETLYLGMDLSEFDLLKKDAISKPPVFLWNHRWEYDKNPDDFFHIFYRLKKAGISFRLIVLGESYKNSPPVFSRLASDFREELLQLGFATQRSEYLDHLYQSDFLLVSSVQEFFGGSVVEAMAAGCYPLLPNRLSYPEHIPNDLQKIHLFNDQEEAYQKTRQWLDEPLRPARELADFVSRYDWRTLATVYDDRFQQMLHR